MRYRIETIDGNECMICYWNEPGYVPVIFSMSDLKDELRVSHTQIRNWVKSGMPQIGHGKYDLLRVYAWLYQKGISKKWSVADYL